tara:strand:+ start:9182 stop:9931 length:750 start_codon:yes stop_codon:yes gene_type:complete
MNSDAADAKNEKAGHGERRYLRIGRESSVQLPGDESWLDELEDEDSVELDEAEGRRLVGNVLDDEWDEGCTILDLDEGSTMQSTATVTPDTEINTSTTAGAEHRSSTIWEDGEKFWSSHTTTPPAPGSPNKPKDRYQPLASSPLASPALSMSATAPTKAGKKRDFEVAKDASAVALSPTENQARDHDSKKRRESSAGSRRASASGNRYRKRSVLGVSTPNVRIHITSPNGHVTMGTPGSLYDAQGFLRF